MDREGRRGEEQPWEPEVPPEEPGSFSLGRPQDRREVIATPFPIKKRRRPINGYLLEIK